MNQGSNPLHPAPATSGHGTGHRLTSCWRWPGVVLAISLLALGGRSLAATPDYPLKRGSNPRYLVDQNERPFLIQGDAPWSLMVQPTREEAEQYLRDRHHKGFNSIIVNLIEHLHCDNPPANRYGDAPFTKAGDFLTPNEAYFAHVDWVLNKAAEYGIQVFLVPSYLGWGGSSQEGWYQEMVANGVDALRQYGRYLGQRYQNFDNLVWLNGGDYSPPQNDYVNAIAEGILATDTQHIHTAHAGEEWSAVECYPTEPWLGINNTYTYVNILAKSRADYLRTPASPFFLIESKYEGDRFNASHQEIRQQAYWSVFSGSCGQFMGNYPIYAFADGWQQAINGDTSHDMANLRRLLDSRPWWNFVPDLDDTIVLAGNGDPESTDPAQAYVTAARIPEGSSLWAYLPTGRTITLDMSKIAGATVQAWWYSPRTGKATAIGQFDNSGSRDFTTPVSEGETQDWILVADDAALNLPPPGMTTLQDWRKTYFTASDLLNPAISGEMADPDQDGRNNLMEYALFGDPTVADASLTPVTIKLAPAGANEFLQLAYTRRTNATDIVCRVTASSNLQSWSLLEEMTQQSHGLTESIMAQDSASPTNAPQRFIRLEMSVSP